MALPAPGTAGRDAGDRPRRAVLGREVIEHPDDIGDPVPSRVGQRAHVDVQRLRGAAVRIDRAGVQTAELGLGAQQVLY